jgi:hypothetical protein
LSDVSLHAPVRRLERFMAQVAPNKESKTIGNIHVNMVDFAQARCGRVV